MCVLRPKVAEGGLVTVAWQVGGVEQGQIEVAADGDDSKGKIRFSDPQEDGRELLDFDPRGQLIEVLSGTDVVLEVFFPDA